ncbi:hypothetical protein GCM10023115_24160 [Pontixanthobacter gangjinensis]|uniref:Cistern family PEP-CTERM protein n=1 Tax=Pontixanthobacter gangjinensis TaxID=1028742 RepID=A0A6I4SQK2_9SPHN|nr:cistern family PEP-CTERM protein [Pontixanthobacter gangjinensis]MXO57658.1 cistern family PEP-CTERM protein [Pontixanthobacter gangjinensis]
MKKNFALSVFAALAATLASPALAEPIMLDENDIGESFTIDYDGFADGIVIDDLTASTTFTLTGASSDTYTFDYVVNNTTDGAVGSRISSFAFNTNPDIIGASSSGTYNFTVLDSTYPNGIGTVDVCFKGGASNSCAGNQGGVTAGGTGTGSLSLSFTGPISSLTLDDFFVRYQSITGVDGIGSASGKQISSTSTSGGTPVPEPGMLGLFAASLMGLGLIRRRRRNALTPN